MSDTPPPDPATKPAWLLAWKAGWKSALNEANAAAWIVFIGLVVVIGIGSLVFDGPPKQPLESSIQNSSSAGLHLQK